MPAPRALKPAVMLMVMLSEKRLLQRATAAAKPASACALPVDVKLKLRAAWASWGAAARSAATMQVLVKRGLRKDIATLRGRTETQRGKGPVLAKCNAGDRGLSHL